MDEIVSRRLRPQHSYFHGWYDAKWTTHLSGHKTEENISVSPGYENPSVGLTVHHYYILRMIFNEKHQNACYMIRKYRSWYSWPVSLYSLFCGQRIFLGGQFLNRSPCTNCSIISRKSLTTFPATSSTKIGATVTKLTPIEDVSVWDCFEDRKCWWILNWTPLSHSWANLKGKLIFGRDCKHRGNIKLLLKVITSLSVSLSDHPSSYHTNLPLNQPQIFLSS